MSEGCIVKCYIDCRCLAVHVCFLDSFLLQYPIQQCTFLRVNPGMLTMPSRRQARVECCQKYLCCGATSMSMMSLSSITTRYETLEGAMLTGGGASESLWILERKAHDRKRYMEPSEIALESSDGVCIRDIERTVIHSCNITDGLWGCSSKSAW